MRHPNNGSKLSVRAGWVTYTLARLGKVKSRFKKLAAGLAEPFLDGDISGRCVIAETGTIGNADARAQNII
jgi:hypothetical protein